MPKQLDGGFVFASNQTVVVNIVVFFFVVAVKISVAAQALNLCPLSF